MVVIAYDIKDEKRLMKVAKYLESLGIRAQKSVFEADIGIRKAKNILEGIREIIDETEDKCFLFKVSKKEDIKASTSVERIF